MLTYCGIRAMRMPNEAAVPEVQLKGQNKREAGNVLRLTT